MKKNFFKNLASVLAVAMVVTTVAPASAAQAATVKLNNASKAIYMSTANGYGVSKGSYTLKISGAAKSATTTWKTSKKSVATVSTKGKVTAKKVGKATITATVKNAKGKTVATKKCAVEIKDNAASVVIKNAEAGKTIGVGVNAFDYDRTMVGSAGGSATDKTFWEITENTAGATVDQKTGKVSTTKTGSFKLQAKTYQNKAKLAEGLFSAKSDVLEVSVPVAVVSVKQVATNKVAVTFNDVVKDVVKASDLKINAEDAIKSALAIKSVSFSEDGKVATVETFSNFKDAQTYTVEYNKVKTSFGATIGKVVDIALNVATAEVGKPTELKPIFTNEAGVDISSTVTGKFEIKVDVVNGYYDTAASKLVMLEKDKTAKVTVTLFATEFDSYGVAKNEIKREFTVTAIDVIPATIGDYVATVATVDFGAVDWTKTTDKVSLSDGNVNLWVKATKTDGTTKTEVNNNAGDWKYTSSNTNVLIVNGRQLTPVAEGVAYVVVKNEANKIEWNIPVYVVGKRAANTIAVDKAYAAASNAVNDNNPKFKVTVKDQFETEMAITNLEIDKVIAKPDNSNPADGKLTMNLSADKKEATFIVKDAVAGKYTYVLKATTANGTKSIVVTIDVQKPEGIQTYDLALSSTDFDTTITDKFDGNNLDLTGKIAIKKGGVVADYAAGTVELKVTKPDNTTVTGTAISVLSVDANKQVKKVLTPGTYKVEATFVDGNNKYDFTKYVTVKDSQAKPESVNVKENVVTAGVLTNVLPTVIEIKQKSTDAAMSSFNFVTAKPEVTSIAKDQNIFVESVEVLLTVKAGAVDYKVPYTVDIKETFTGK